MKVGMSLDSWTSGHEPRFLDFIVMKVKPLPENRILAPPTGHARVANGAGHLLLSVVQHRYLSGLIRNRRQISRDFV